MGARQVFEKPVTTKGTIPLTALKDLNAASKTKYTKEEKIYKFARLPPS